MKIDILTIFPKMFCGPMTESILAKAREKKLIEINCIDIRSFSKDKHKKVDDKPFGGGAGMVMKPEPLYDALKSAGVKKRNKEYKNPYNKPLVIFMSPQGKTLNCEIVKDLSKFKHLVILCGHYEGVDERIMDFVDEEISIGDYVLTGGEIPAMVLVDSVARMIPGVVKDENSVKNDSFFNGMLDYPHYTRPAVFKGKKVPDILLSGNHKEIDGWRKKQSFERTKKRRPDLIKIQQFNKEE
ncbi:MAG: tRNA (guanosine(37)-N1)-methyltransferase TrmD [Endomicrobia bacterium]|nr:tRNA (guanosine(37)-N1)-methyltransferase TrmD [Endomicrobiia bacterium]MCL2506070.1 tRNA (guanosine(37)-N1)-methyltransferase TrmD [Endomicrobiia bacterium]